MTNENKEHTLIGSLRKTLGHISYNSPALTLTLKCRNHVLSTTNNKSNIYGFIGIRILQGFLSYHAQIECGIRESDGTRSRVPQGEGTIPNLTSAVHL